jgi:hypothetical protein
MIRKGGEGDEGKEMRGWGKGRKGEDGDEGKVKRGKEIR